MTARPLRRLLVVAMALIALVSAGVGAAPDAEAAPRWAPLPRATIRPGTMLITVDGQCTANFVFVQGGDVFLGQAAHCSRLGDDINGCTARNRPLGTPVTIEGASRPGTLVYSSWIAMQAAGERNPGTCLHNDFALVRVDPADHGRINPTVPHWGGPTGVGRRPALGTTVYSYGDSILRQGLPLLQPRSGTVSAHEPSGWRHIAYFLLPGIPGDSGSGVLDSKGRAVGVLATIGLARYPLSNGVTDLSRAMAYARNHGFPALQLARGTQPPHPERLPFG